MDLTRISDIAARQSIDSTRVFREWVRVRRELDAMEGSVFWKKVGDYEYFAHKVRGTTRYKGVRSAATEAGFVDFTAKKQRLKARHKLLKESVLTSQRLNKAVHAGTVPTEIIELLTVLEDHGLSDGSLILGAPALYAYGQSSGVRLPSVTLDGQKGSLLPSHPDDLRLLIKRLKEPAIDVGTVLKKALHQIAEVHVRSSRSSAWVDLQVHFGRVRQEGRPAPSKAGMPSVKAAAKVLAATPERDPSTGSAGWPTCGTETFAKWLEHAPSFEQVVVGKTGKMAMMRTLDPKAYVTVLKLVRDAVAPPALDDKAALLLRFVEEMIGESMVVTKLDDASQQALQKEVRAWLALSVAADPPNSDGAEAQAHRSLAV